MTVKIDVLGVWQLVIVILLESRVRVNNLHCSCQLEAAELLPNLYIYITVSHMDNLPAASTTKSSNAKFRKKLCRCSLMNR